MSGFAKVSPSCMPLVDMLVGMTCADVVDVLGERVKELRSVEAVGSLDELCLVLWIAHHLGETSQRLAHATYLTGDIHIPHFIAVAWFGTAFILCAISLHISAIVHTVPSPKSHVLGYQESLFGNLLVIKLPIPSQRRWKSRPAPYIGLTTSLGAVARYQTTGRFSTKMKLATGIMLS